MHGLFIRLSGMPLELRCLDNLRFDCMCTFLVIAIYMELWIIVQYTSCNLQGTIGDVPSSNKQFALSTLSEHNSWIDSDPTLSASSKQFSGTAARTIH